jgi:hypothetical protein
MLTALAVVAFPHLFTNHATWKLPCESASHATLTCAISNLRPAGTAMRSHLACTGIDVGEDLGAGITALELYANASGLWTTTDDGQPLTSTALNAAPRLAAHPTPSKISVPTPTDPYMGDIFTVVKHGDSWCAITQPFGTGGAPHAFALCVAPDGNITGVAATKDDSSLAFLSCGATPTADELLGRSAAAR